MKQSRSGAGSKWSRLEVEQARRGAVFEVEQARRWSKLEVQQARSGAGSKWSRLKMEQGSMWSKLEAILKQAQSRAGLKW